LPDQTTDLAGTAPGAVATGAVTVTGEPAFVRFDGVSVTYNAGGRQATLALTPTDLGFARGDFVCIVGPSGCGKTTLMQTLAGFLKPTAGTVSVGGVAITGPGPDRGVVFQQAALFPWKTVAANVGFALAYALLLESLGQAIRGAGFAIPGALGIQEGGYLLLAPVVGLQPGAAIALSLAKRSRELLLGLPGLLYLRLASRAIAVS